MKYFAFLQTFIFLVAIFQPIMNFLTFQKPIWLTILRGLWPKKIFRCFYLKEPKSWNIYGWNSCGMLDRNFRPYECWDQKVWKTDPHFFLKKWGSVFFSFLIWAFLRPKIAICIFTIFFTHNIFIILTPWNQNISKKIIWS